MLPLEESEALITMLSVLYTDVLEFKIDRSKDNILITTRVKIIDIDDFDNIIPNSSYVVFRDKPNTIIENHIKNISEFYSKKNIIIL